jgi:hypothetical protein
VLEEFGGDLVGIDRNLDAGMTLLRAARRSGDRRLDQGELAAALTERKNQVSTPQAIVGAQGQFALRRRERAAGRRVEQGPRRSRRRNSRSCSASS